MADEKRIIEIVVKAVGDADLKRLARELASMRKEAATSRGELQKANTELAKMGRDAAAARKEVAQTNKTLDAFGATMSKAVKAFGVGFAVTKLVQSSDAVKDLNRNVQDLSGTFIDATLEAVGFTDLLDDEFWESAKQGARELAAEIGKVFQGLKDAGVAVGLIAPTVAPIEIGTILPEAWQRRFATVSSDTAQAMQQNFQAISSQVMRDLERENRRNAQERIEAASDYREYIAGMRERARDPMRLDANIETNLRQLTQDIDQAFEPMKVNMDEVGQSMQQLTQESERFRENWDMIAKTTWSWDEGLNNALDIMQEMQDAQSDLTNQSLEWGMALTSSFKGVLTGELHNTRDVLRAITTDMRNFYAELAAREAASQTLSWVRTAIGALGSATTGTSTGSFTGNNPWAGAKGGAFDDGKLIAMANGGIVTKPTIFPMAHGMGLMGEAGPEAVMPLKRNREGKLGVAASMPAITVVNNLGVAAAARTEYQGDGRMSIILEAAQLGANMAEQRINTSMRSGYGVTAQSMQSSYGLRRRV